jgi:uncharacterized protein (TIGR03437 family)
VGNGLNFSAPADQPLTPDVTLPQVVRVGSVVDGVPFVLSEAYLSLGKGPNFVTVSPASGTTPAEVSISLNPSVVPYLAPGIYNVSLIFKSTNPAFPGISGFNVFLSLNGSSTPATITSIVNSASQAGSFSPGELTTIYGSNLGTQPVSATYSYSTGFGNMTLYPTSLGNTTVSLGGFPAPLLYVSPTQINAVVPYEVAGAQNALPVIVTHDSIASAPFPVTIASTAPGIFAIAANGQGQGAISNINPQTGAATVNGTSNPAPKGRPSCSTLPAPGFGASPRLTEQSSRMCSTLPTMFRKSRSR